MQPSCTIQTCKRKALHPLDVTYLVESPNLVWRKGPNNRVQHASVMEDHEVLLAPVMRVHERWRNRRALHAVQNLADLLQISDLCAVGVKCAFPRGSLREWVHNESSSAAWMNLEVQAACDGVLPELDPQGI
jgi:hypothetical protein